MYILDLLGTYFPAFVLLRVFTFHSFSIVCKQTAFEPFIIIVWFLMLLHSKTHFILLITFCIRKTFIVALHYDNPIFTFMYIKLIDHITCS